MSVSRYDLWYYALAGWDGSEIRAVTFREADGFEACEVDGFMSPHVNMRPEKASDVIEVAAAQLRFVQMETRGANGGMLDVVNSAQPAWPRRASNC